jgi:hypothetical protein
LYLTQRQNSANVKKIRGKVEKARIGRNRAFKIPNTAAEIAALRKLSISTPIVKSGNN